MKNNIIIGIIIQLLLVSCSTNLSNINQGKQSVSPTSINETIHMATPKNINNISVKENENEIFNQKQKCAEMKKSKEFELKAINQKNYDAVNGQLAILNDDLEKAKNIPDYPISSTEPLTIKPPSEKEMKDYVEKMKIYQASLTQPRKEKPFSQKYIQESFYSHSRISCIGVMQEKSEKNIITLSLEDLLNGEVIFSAIDCNDKTNKICMQKRNELDIQYNNLKK